MSVNEIASLVKEAEDISRTDVGKAIALLEEFQGDGSFWPWGALALLRLYIKDNRLEGASSLCESFSGEYRSFMPAFGSRLRLHRGKGEYLAEVASMFAVVQSAERYPAWFRRDFIEIVMGSASPDFVDVVERGLASGALDPIHAAGMKRLMPMIVGIDAFMNARRRYPAPSGHAPAGWTFAFLDTGSACVEMNNIVYVNLAPLGLATIEGWEKELAGIFAIVVCGLMDWAPYVDDSGVLSWPSVRSEDAYTADRKSVV